MTERQRDQAWLEQNRAENEARANAEPLTYRGIKIVFDGSFPEGSYALGYVPGSRL